MKKSTHPLYMTWHNMKHRCFNDKLRSWKDYGGRGIMVCERWLTFENFVADMGSRPKGYTLDRINNDGNYEPSNCRWATRKEQCENKRSRARKMRVPSKNPVGKPARKLTINGQTRTITEWAQNTGVAAQTIRERLRAGLPPDEAVLKRRARRPNSVDWKTLPQVIVVARRGDKHRPIERMLIFEGETLSLNEWARRLCIKRSTLCERLRRGWSVEQALSTDPCSGRWH